MPSLLFPQPGPSDGALTATHWTVVGVVVDGAEEARMAALGELIRKYHEPLLGYLRRRFTFSSVSHEDVLQRFWVKVLEKNTFEKARQDRGRFRTFLITVLKNLALDIVREEKSQPVKSPPALAAEPDHELVRAWARRVLEQALDEMQHECEVSGFEDIWQVFEASLVRPSLEGVPRPSHAELASQLGLEEAAKAASLLNSAKRIFRRNLRETIGQYESRSADIDREIKEFIAIFARENGPPSDPFATSTPLPS